MRHLAAQRGVAQPPAMLTYRRMLRLQPTARLALNHDATHAINFVKDLA